MDYLATCENVKIEIYWKKSKDMKINFNVKEKQKEMKQN